MNSRRIGWRRDLERGRGAGAPALFLTSKLFFTARKIGVNERVELQLLVDFRRVLVTFYVVRFVLVNVIADRATPGVDGGDF